jgi:hypothetical protein
VKNSLALLAGVLALAGAIPYIIDILKGKTHPNLVTWITWSVINVVTTLATLSSGASQAAVLSAAATIGTFIIMILALKFGVRRYTRFDIVCQASAIVGIIAWRLTNDALLAIAIAQIVILVAAVPTWHHAWKSPFAETWQAFAISGTGGILTLISLTTYSFATLASPIVFVLNSFTIVAICLYRRRLRPGRSRSAQAQPE